MDYFTATGDWWIPGDQENQVSGTLDFSSRGVTLILNGCLSIRRQELSQEDESDGIGVWITVPIIHGRTSNMRDVTIFEAQTFTTKAFHRHQIRERFTARLALFGHCAMWDRFSEARIEFDRLHAWSDAPSINEDSQNTNYAIVRTSPQDSMRVKIGDDNVILRSEVVGSWDNSTCHLDQRSAFYIELSQPLRYHEIVETLLRPLQDLLIYCLGNPVRTSSLKLWPNDTNVREYCDAYFNAVQPNQNEEHSFTSPWSYTEPTLLTAQKSPIRIENLVPSWFRLWNAWRPVFIHLLAPFYAPFIYSEHRYSSAFQSAEALHDLNVETFSSAQLDKNNHKLRVKSAINALADADVPEETIQWAQRVLQSRNDKTLRDKINDLTKSTGSVGQKVFDAVPDFAQIVTARRASVAHPAARMGGDDAVARYWCCEVLTWVVRSRLLLDLGCALHDVERLVLNRHAFTHAVSQLQKYERDNTDSSA